MFLEEIEKISRIFASLAKEKNLKVFYHFDADGLTSASVFAKMLIREGINFELRTIKQLTREIVDNLKFSEKDFFVFLDLGSGQVDMMGKILEKTHVLILDHHESRELSNLNLFHLNPTFFGEEISSSMLCYLFAKSLNLRNADLIDLAIVGAVGDELDEKWEFKGELCRKMLQEAEDLGKIIVMKGLRLYGRGTRPIHKSLELSFDPFIPGISGSESNAVQFLSELGIKIKEGEEWVKLRDLAQEEQKRLASAIIIERLRAKRLDASDIFGEIYIIPGRPEELQDAREFATLLNACGRLGSSHTGIMLCLNDFKAVEDSKELLSEYRKVISDGINWIRQSKEAILETNFATYAFCEGRVPDTLIGTITSILLNSNLINTEKPVFGFAEAEEEKIKVSARASRGVEINLRKVIVKASEQLGEEGGGHALAAGSLIRKDKKEEFVKIVEKILGEEIGGKN